MYTYIKRHAGITSKNENKINDGCTISLPFHLCVEGTLYACVCPDSHTQLANDTTTVVSVSFFISLEMSLFSEYFREKSECIQTL